MLCLVVDGVSRCSDACSVWKDRLLTTLLYVIKYTLSESHYPLSEQSISQGSLKLIHAMGDATGTDKRRLTSTYKTNAVTLLPSDIRMSATLSRRYGIRYFSSVSSHSLADAAHAAPSSSSTFSDAAIWEHRSGGSSETGSSWREIPHQIPARLGGNVP